MIRQRVAQDIMVRLEATDALLRWNNLAIVGEVESGISHLLYGLIEWAFRQLFPDSAEGEYLERWASIWGVLRRPATPARGTATWALAGEGSFIPTDTLVARADGFQYRVTQGAAMASGAITVPIEATLTGARGNALEGVQLTMQTSVVGVTPTGNVDAPGVGGGANQESDALLLQRLLSRIRQPPQGGSANDYVMWAMEVPGVTRAWAYPIELGPGTVVVRVMTDDSTQDGIPDPATLALVQAHIDARKPVTASVFVLAPTPTPLDVHITSLEPNTPEIHSAITSALHDLLRREAVPGARFYVNLLYGAINTVPGVIRFTLVSPPTDVVPAHGHILTLGEVTFAE